MTIGGAIAELQNLLNADDVPFYYKGGIEKVIETIRMETADRKTEPQTNADQHVQHVESVETMSCEECKHWIFTSQWGWFCPLKGQDECHYEPIEDEPQTDCAWK